MSRIIVKQLPKNISEEKIRNLFATKGTITDIQLKYTPDGKFRQFCFIGYRSEEEARAAIAHFNNTCVQTSRIKVESCAALGSEEKPQSWSKHAKDSKRNPEAIKAKEAEDLKRREEREKESKKNKTSKIDEILGEHKNDPDFLEFMEAHDKNRTLWANDGNLANAEQVVDEPKDKTVTSVAVVNDETAAIDSGVADEDDEQDDDHADNENDEKLAAKPISDLEYMKSLMSKSNDVKKNESKEISKKITTDLDLFTIKIHNVPYKIKRQEVLKFFKPLKPYSVRLPSKVHGFCYVGFKTEKEMTKAMLKDKSFIKGKQVFFADFTEKNKITKSKLTDGDAAQTSNQPSNAKWQQQEESIRTEEDISESGRIFFRNLPYTTTEEELQTLFEQFGPINEVHLPVDSITRQIKGFGTVTFMMPEHALQAFNKLDGTDFHGRLLHLIPAKSKPEPEENENDENLSFQQKKTIKLKKQAQQSATWNTLFMGANAVAEILSKQFNMSKEQILDSSGGGSNAAVRLALGETQIVVEMKKFLEDQGVRLDAFDGQKSKRSKTVILAKNLAAGTTAEELTPLFAKFGPIGRFVLPPSGITALIEFCEPTEARQAFKKLAFSKFKSLPLFLEWAPEHVFTTTLSGEPTIPKLESTPKKEEIKDEPKKEQIVEDQVEEPTEAVERPEDADDDPEPNTTLFLRNLNFKTVLDTIYKHFDKLGTIHTVEIAKRKDPENPRQMNSLGYGFIQFKKAATAERALKNMQLTYIDGNQVELKRSDRVLRSASNANPQRKQVSLTKQTGTKILVRNIPFQANQKEVRDIFKAFGELRSLRLPRKMTPGEDAHRGFGFVDYVTKGDAKKAFEALGASTHLYGRRLVLEWASTTDEADVDMLRKRTAAQYSSGGGDATAAKRSNRAVVDAAGSMHHVTADDEDDDA